MNQQMNLLKLWIVILGIGFLNGCTNHSSEKLDMEAFGNPSDSFAVHTWWHWVDNAISREGITRDLEAMRMQGISKATILNVSLFDEEDFGVPKVIFGSEEWFRMFQWSLKEANRLGIKIGVHNCDGWSSSGGPWISPEHSMKYCTWSKSFVEGGKSMRVQLPKPFSQMDFYRDIKVLAFRAGEPENLFHKKKPKINVDQSYTGGTLFDGNPFSMVGIKNKTTIDIDFEKEFSTDKIAIHLRREFQRKKYTDLQLDISLKASLNGKSYHEIKRITNPAINKTVLCDIPKTAARFFRVEIIKQNDPEPSRELGISELELLTGNESPAYFPSISNHLEKIVTTKADHVDELFEPDQIPLNQINQDDIIDLTELMQQDGTLEWNAPAGYWTVLRIGYTTTGETNHPATSAGLGLEVDKMDSTALNIHFADFPMKLINSAGEYLGNTFEFLLVDSWECKYQNWTGNFSQEFEKRRGYPVTPWLPVLCGITSESPESTERFLYDYRKTIAELIEKNYYKHFSELYHRNGLKFHTEVIYGDRPTIFPPLDYMKSNSYIDVPMHEFWEWLPRGQVEQSKNSVVADAGTLYGKKIIAAEAYTGGADFKESPWELKLYGDNAFCTGINQMVLHSYVHQATEKSPGVTLGRYGQSFNRHNPWWKFSSQWLTYQARVQYLLQKGLRSCEILEFIGDRFYYNAWGENGYYQIPKEYAIQKCNADILLHHSKVENGDIVLDNGMHYQILLLPPDSCMEISTLRRISELAKMGATIIGPKPVKTLSYLNHKENDEELNSLASSMWGNSNNNATSVNTYGHGKIDESRDIKIILDDLNITPGFSIKNGGLFPLPYHIHKKIGDNDVFFVVNQEDSIVKRVCNFSVKDKYPEIWDPVYGKIYRPSNFDRKDGIISIPVSFQPRQALFFVFTSKENKKLPYWQSPKEIFRLKDFKGSLTFDAGPAKETVDIKQFESWTDFDKPNIKYYSGTASYRIVFDLPQDIIAQKSLFVSLGNFSVGCSLEINGKRLGYATFPDYRFDVTGLVKEKNNVLNIRVANNYMNRIIGDLTEYGKLKNVWTTSPIGQFYSKESLLQPSGILGPVSFYTQENEK